MGEQIVNNRKIIGPQNEQIIEKLSFPMVKENNCNDGDVKPFQKEAVLHRC